MHRCCAPLISSGDSKTYLKLHLQQIQPKAKSFRRGAPLISSQQWLKMKFHKGSGEKQIPVKVHECPVRPSESCLPSNPVFGPTCCNRLEMGKPQPRPAWTVLTGVAMAIISNPPLPPATSAQPQQLRGSFPRGQEEKKKKKIPNRAMFVGQVAEASGAEEQEVVLGEEREG